MLPVLDRERVVQKIVYEPAGENGGSKRFKWTARQYHRMAELGFFKGKRVELIKGEIIEMAPMGTPHSTAVRLLIEALRKSFGKGYLVDSQLPMSFGSSDEPEPDVSVLWGGPRDFLDKHPSQASLLVGVSNATLRFDRREKAELYAENKIAEYWILNLKQRCLEVYRHPVRDKNAGFIYTEIFVVGEDKSISPLAKPKSKIKVADILP